MHKIIRIIQREGLIRGYMQYVNIKFMIPMKKFEIHILIHSIVFLTFFYKCPLDWNSHESFHESVVLIR